MVPSHRRDQLVKGRQTLAGQNRQPSRDCSMAIKDK